MLTGWVVFKYIGKLNKWSWAVGLLIISLIMFYTGLPCTEIFGGCAVFIIANLLPVHRKDLSQNLRMQSIWIYYLHMYVIYFVTLIVRHYGRVPQLWPTFIAVSTVTMIIAALITHTSRNKRVSWIQSLIK